MEPIESATPVRTRPPAYAKICLALFGISVAIGCFSAWEFLSGERNGIRRGYSPPTAEWKTNRLCIADPERHRALACGLLESGNNELGRHYEYRTTELTPGGACVRNNAVSLPVFAVAIGDSFTFGNRVDLSAVWTKVLERSIGGEVVNLGVPATGPSSYLMSYKKLGVPLHPKIVIVTLFVNDWLDEACFEAWQAERNRLGALVDFPRSDAIFDAVRRNAYRMPPDWANPPLGERVQLHIRGEDNAMDESAYAAQDLRSPTIARGKERTEQALSSIKETAAREKSKLLIVIIPPREDVYFDLVSKESAYARTAPTGAFCRATAQWCHSNGIDTIDMLPILMKRAAGGTSPYFPVDAHFREEGNAIVAEEIAAYLKGNQLLPEPHP